MFALARAAPHHVRSWFSAVMAGSMPPMVRAPPGALAPPSAIGPLVSRRTVENTSCGCARCRKKLARGGAAPKWPLLGPSPCTLVLTCGLASLVHAAGVRIRRACRMQAAAHTIGSLRHGARRPTLSWT